MGSGARRRFDYTKRLYIILTNYISNSSFHDVLKKQRLLANLPRIPICRAVFRKCAVFKTAQNTFNIKWRRLPVAIGF